MSNIQEKEIMNPNNMSPEEIAAFVANYNAMQERLARVEAEKEAAVREVHQLKKEKKRKSKKLVVKNLKPMTLKFCRKMLNYWRGERHHQYVSALTLYLGFMENRHRKYAQILKAPPKSGKRIIAEIIACLLFNDCHNDDEELCKVKDLKPSDYVTPIHVTGFNRKDCKGQLEEMREKYGFYSEAVSSNKHSADLLKDYIERENITDERKRNAIVIIDEADYASGRSMKLEPWINEWNGSAIYVSATPEEVIAGFNLNTKPDDYKIETYTPALKFKGKKWFHENGLIHKPEPFTYITNPKPSNFKNLTDEEKKIYEHEVIDISHHGKKIIYDCQEKMKEYKNIKEGMNDRNHGKRNVVFVRKVPNKRYSYSFMKQKLKSSTSMKTTAGIIYDNYIDETGNAHEIKYKMEFVDGEENSGFQLDNACHWEERCSHDCVIVLFVCCMASRSTELAQPDERLRKPGAHHYIHAFHDNRILKNTSNYNSLAQAGGRVNHYDKFGHPIQLYLCNLTCMIEGEIGDWREQKAKLSNISARCSRKYSASENSSSSDGSDADDDIERNSHIPTTRSAYYVIGNNNRINRNKNQEIIIKKFRLDEYDSVKSTAKAAKEYTKSIGAKNGLSIKSLLNRKNEDGFYEAVVRKNTKVYSTEELEKEKTCSIDNGAGYQRNPCYRDTTDKTTLEIWVIHRKRKETETNRVADNGANFFDNMA